LNKGQIIFLYFLLCLKCARSSFQEKSSGFERKEDFTSDFKEDLRFEEAPSIKNSRTEENRTTHERATRVHGRAPQAEPAEFGTATSRAAVPGCTATRVPDARPCGLARPCRLPARAIMRFCDLFMCFSFGGFGDFFQTSLSNT